MLTSVLTAKRQKHNRPYRGRLVALHRSWVLMLMVLAGTILAWSSGAHAESPAGGKASALLYPTYVDTSREPAQALRPCAPREATSQGNATTEATAPVTTPAIPAAGAAEDGATPQGNPDVPESVGSSAPSDDCLPASPEPPSDGAAQPIDPHWIDTLLTEAILDLGLGSVAMAPLERSELAKLQDLEQRLIAQGKDRWVISASLIAAQPQWRLRISVLAPGKRTLLVQQSPVRADEVEVRVSAMMRDLVLASGGDAPALHPATATTPDEIRHSNGRAALALNAAVLGGYVGFSLQRASGPGDSRLTYPLLALGTGVGLGASTIIAEEWDVTVADAWYLSAAALWPTVGLLALDSAYEKTPRSRRYLRSLSATTGGLALATLGLTQGNITQGDASLTHSGGAWGALFGALGQAFVEGNADTDPSKGLGFGSIFGLVTAGTLVAFLDAPRPESVLIIDLSAGLGLLTGAALASPLILADEQTARRDRAGIAIVGAGAAVGALVGFLTQAGATQSATHEPAPRTAELTWEPYLQPQQDWARSRRSFLSLGAHGSW